MKQIRNMTPKQEERLRNKIVRVRKELAADKKQWGGYYHDGRGLRYLPLELFIKLRDYKGGLRYLRWFDKAFPDDACYTIFLFEWTLILFKVGKVAEAEKKLLQTFFSNTYIFDKFLGKAFLSPNKGENPDWKSTSLEEYFHYDKAEPELNDFVEWLERAKANDKIVKLANEFIEIEEQIQDEPLGKTRTELINRQHNLLDKF